MCEYMRANSFCAIFAIVTFFLANSSFAQDQTVHIQLVDVYTADAFADASVVAASDQPYLLKPSGYSRGLIPFEDTEKAKCWIEKYEVRVLDGFTDAITMEYSQMREQSLLKLYLNFFNRKVLQEMRRLGKLDCPIR